MIVGKTELIKSVAAETKLTKAEIQKVIEAFLSNIGASLKKGENVRLVGFGSFAVQQLAARNGRNPRTGETIKIKASKRPVFRAGKELKDAVNSK